MRRKVCFKCGKRRGITQFYKHSQMEDGYLNKCKECAKADSRDTYNTNRRDSEWLLKERRRQRDKEQKRRAEGKVKKYDRLEATRKWRQKNKLKQAAHNAVARALKNGILNKSPCEVCSKKKVESHHEDYSKPLEVVWLCSKHHSARHVEIREKQVVR